MIRIIRWFFRPASPPPERQCGHCRSALEICPACEGEWTHCDCGIGMRCPNCGPYWV